MRRLLGICLIAAILPLAGCAVWPVNQDPAGVEYRQSANHILFALQDYRKRKGAFPARLDALVPDYLPALPDVPSLRYDPRSGALAYRYIPSFPQLRWTWCNSVGDTTDWRCEEHLL